LLAQHRSHHSLTAPQERGARHCLGSVLSVLLLCWLGSLTPVQQLQWREHLWPWLLHSVQHLAPSHGWRLGTGWSLHGQGFWMHRLELQGWVVLLSVLWPLASSTALHQHSQELMWMEQVMWHELVKGELQVQQLAQPP